MARSLLIGAVSALLLASVSAQTTVRIETFEPGTSTCPAGEAITTREVVVNTCVPGQIKYFCDAQFTYQVSYSSADCAALTDVTSITQFQNKCGWRAINEQYSCLNVTAGTGAYPFNAFPPTNFGVSNKFYNRTDNGAAITQCITNDANIMAVPTAAPACTKRQAASNTPGSSMLSTCNTQGTLSTNVVYANDDCTGNIIHATQAPITCTNGVQPTCNRPATPSGIPTVGVYTYTTTPDCNQADANAPYVLDLYSSSCFDSTKLQCISYANSTAVADFYTYSDNTCSATTPQAETFFDANACIRVTDTLSKKYVCSVNPGPGPDNGNSAPSTASVSIVAALFAAVAAFVAGKAQ